MGTCDRCKRVLVARSAQVVADIRLGIYAIVCPTCADRLRQLLAQDKTVQGQGVKQGASR